MKKEKLILSFIATIFGLLVAGVAFYFYQGTKNVPDNATRIVISASPSPTASPSIFLTLDQPKDEEVVTNKVQTVSGKTQNNAVIVVITDSSEETITPSPSGEFSTTVNLDEGENNLEVISIAPNGKSITNNRTITYSLEEF
jgi:hypothetical protein